MASSCSTDVTCRDSRLDLYLNTQGVTAMISPPRELDPQWRLLLQPIQQYQARLLAGYRDLEQQVASLNAELAKARAALAASRKHGKKALLLNADLVQARTERDVAITACQERDCVIAFQTNTVVHQAAALQGASRQGVTYARAEFNAAYVQLKQDVIGKDRVIAHLNKTIAALQGVTYERAEINAAYLQLQQDVLAKDRVIDDLNKTIAALQSRSVAVHTHGVRSAWNQLGQDKECSICLADLMETQYDVLQCFNGHAICSGCLDQMPEVDRVCPTCRDSRPMVKNVLLTKLRSALWMGSDEGGDVEGNGVEFQPGIHPLATASGGVEFQPGFHPLATASGGVGFQPGFHPLATASGGVEFQHDTQQCGEKGCLVMIKIGNYQGPPEFFRCPLHRPSNEGLPCERVVNGKKCSQPATKESKGHKAYCCEHLHRHAKKLQNAF